GINDNFAPGIRRSNGERFAGRVHDGLGPAVLFNYVDLTVEGVSKIIVGFGAGTIKQKIPILANGSAGIGDADAILPAAIARLWPRVHPGDHFPSAGHRINSLLRLRIE